VLESILRAKTANDNSTNSIILQPIIQIYARNRRF